MSCFHLNPLVHAGIFQHKLLTTQGTSNLLLAILGSLFKLMQRMICKAVSAFQTSYTLLSASSSSYKSAACNFFTRSAFLLLLAVILNVIF